MARFVFLSEKAQVDELKKHVSHQVRLVPVKDYVMLECQNCSQALMAIDTFEEDADDGNDHPTEPL